LVVDNGGRILKAMLLLDEVPEILRVFREVAEELEEALRKPVPDALTMPEMDFEFVVCLTVSPARSIRVLRCFVGGSVTVLY